MNTLANFWGKTNLVVLVAQKIVVYNPNTTMANLSFIFNLSFFNTKLIALQIFFEKKKT